MRVTIDGVSHDYGKTQVLRDISLTIDEGEIVSVIGPSGCGKSTLLRFVGGLERPDRGRVLLSGEPPAGSLNPLTYIFQDFALLPWRTVEGNVRLVLEDHGIGEGGDARSIVDDVLAAHRAFGFPRRLAALSFRAGIKQRVAIARAAQRPRPGGRMLMDEPLSCARQRRPASC